MRIQVPNVPNSTEITSYPQAHQPQLCPRPWGVPETASVRTSQASHDQTWRKQKMRRQRISLWTKVYSQQNSLNSEGIFF